MQAIRSFRPVGLYGLTGVLLFMSFGALFGGYSLVRDPSGALLGMSVEWLGNTGFANYWIPGLILFTTLGILPLVAVFLLWLRPRWGLMRGLESFFHIHWVWGVAFGVGLAQMIWIVFQVATMGWLFWLQPTMFTVGLLIVGLCLLPSVRHYYGHS